MKLTQSEKKLILLKRKRTKIVKNSRELTASRKSSTPSKGEQAIINFLTLEMVTFRREWFFSSCYSPKTHRLLYFDFYLPEFNLCIEYDGAQHYSNTKPEAQKLNDFVKTAYCLKNRINLLRIKYDQFPFIEMLICEKVDSIMCAHN